MRILINRIPYFLRCECKYIKSCLNSKSKSTLTTPKVDENFSKSLNKTDSKVKRYDLKTPKGTRDFGPQEMAIRSRVLEKIVSIFKLHGAQTIDTPAIEMKDILTDHYGEDSKLLFDVAEPAREGGEIYSLRYDLTVPFTRFLAMNGFRNFKRYQIAKVYRKDKPVMIRGRYREFYQCDFDISGTYDPMVTDAECVRIMSEILRVVDIGNFKIKINHRLLIDGIFDVCGVPSEKFKSICTCIDKLDKESWEVIRQEMINVRGLQESVADEVGEYVKLSGGIDLVDRLRTDEKFCNLKSAVAALDDLKLLLRYCELYGIRDKIVLDLSLARGLDYYTGVIFEAVLLDHIAGDDGEELGVGSVAGGGRYDNLVEKFEPDLGKVPCVGISIGLERIFTILEAKLGKNDDLRASEVQVFVASAHRGLLEEKIKLITELWDGKIKAEQFYRHTKKLLDQLQHCEQYKIPLALIIGNSEIENNVVKIRDVVTRVETEVPRSNLIEELRKRIEKINSPQKM